jgi:hypothetical protein
MGNDLHYSIVVKLDRLELLVLRCSLLVSNDLSVFIFDASPLLSDSKHGARVLLECGLAVAKSRLEDMELKAVPQLLLGDVKLRLGGHVIIFLRLL